MGGQHYSIEVRKAAVEEYIKAGSPAPDQLRNVVSSFRGRCPPPPAGDGPLNPSEFVHHWVREWNERGSVRSRSPLPRKPYIDDDVARQCVAQLKAGFMDKGRQRCYSSMRQAARRNAFISGVLAGYRDIDGQPLSACTLWRRCKAVSPGLSRKTLRYVFKLTPEHKHLRLQYCARLMAMPALQRNQYLARVVWIDSKKMYVAPEARLVYANSSAQLHVQDRRVAASGFSAKKIFYYGAACAVFGGLFWKAGTGTSRQRLPNGNWWAPYDKPYMVSGWRAASHA
jgi:hypothetical protein